MSTPITRTVVLNEDTDKERSVEVVATVSIYARRVFVDSIEARDGSPLHLTQLELEEAYDQISQYVLDYRRDIPDEAREDLRSYPRGGGSD